MSDGRDGRRLRATGIAQKNTATSAAKLGSFLVFIMTLIALFVDDVPLKPALNISVTLIVAIVIVGIIAWYDGQRKIARGITEEWIDSGNVANDPPV